MDHADADAVWSYIDTVGGDIGPTMQADPDNCPLIDEVAIAARYIVPPHGVVACCFGDGFEDGDRARQPRPGVQRRARGPLSATSWRTAPRWAGESSNRYPRAVDVLPRTRLPHTFPGVAARTTGARAAATLAESVASYLRGADGWRRG